MSVKPDGQASTVAVTYGDHLGPGLMLGEAPLCRLRQGLSEEKPGILTDHLSGDVPQKLLSSRAPSSDHAVGIQGSRHRHGGRSYANGSSRHVDLHATD